jgi:hypothetical protein
MRRALTLILGVALFGILAAVVVASQGADDPANHDQTVTETVDRTTTVEDRNKARERRHDDARENEDVRGPCDEAEHANDPRCTGQGTTPPAGEDNGAADDNRVDNSGPGSQNSGPGSVHSGRDDNADDNDRGEVEPGDDRGGQREVEVGDDRGDHGEVETGDDRGGNSGPGGGGEVESGDDHGDNSGHGGGGHDD